MCQVIFMHRCTPRPCQPRCQYLPFAEHITRFPKHSVCVFSNILNSSTSAPSCAPSSWQPWTSPAWSWPAPASAPGRPGRPAPPPEKKKEDAFVTIKFAYDEKGNGPQKKKRSETGHGKRNAMEWGGESAAGKSPGNSDNSLFLFFCGGESDKIMLLSSLTCSLSLISRSILALLSAATSSSVAPAPVPSSSSSLFRAVIFSSLYSRSSFMACISQRRKRQIKISPFPAIWHFLIFYFFLRSTSREFRMTHYCYTRARKHLLDLHSQCTEQLKDT